MATTITIVGSVGPLAGGETKTVAAALTNPLAIGQILDLILPSGDSTIAVPVGAAGVLISPSAGNAVALRLKGLAGDTGILLSKTQPTLLALDPGQATLIINAASLTTGYTEFNFW